jgi:hypothetical protein
MPVLSQRAAEPPFPGRSARARRATACQQFFELVHNVWLNDVFDFIGIVMDVLGATSA